jgi:hypothetical protein
MDTRVDGIRPKGNISSDPQSATSFQNEIRSWDV